MRATDKAGPASVAAPVTFRPKSQADRALLEAVAMHSGTSLSKFVAEATAELARRYVKMAGGAEKFAADLEEIRQRQQRQSARWLSEVLDETEDDTELNEPEDKTPTSGIDDGSPVRESSSSTRTNR